VAIDAILVKSRKAVAHFKHSLCQNQLQISKFAYFKKIVSSKSEKSQLILHEF